MGGLASWDAGLLLGMVGLLSGLLLVAWLERRPSTWHLGFTAAFLLFGAVHLFFAGRTGALWATLALIAIIGGTSKLKYRYLGFNFLAGDVYHLGGPTIWGLANDHKRLVVSGAAATIVILASAILIANLVEEPAIPLQARLGMFGVTVLLYFIAFWISGGPGRFRLQLITQDRAHLSGFVASWFGAGPSRRPRFVDIAPDPLPLLPATAAHSAADQRMPHIFMVMHESTFDPRALSLPVNDAFEQFLAPPGSLSGTLHVDIFGGGTIQSEFSALTGLSSLSFGADSRYVSYLLAGRIRHSLPFFLAKLGYRVSLVSCDAPASFNCGQFYESIGIRDVDYAKLLPAPFDAARWQIEHHDQQLFDHALDKFSMRAGGGPCFMSIMTLMNHGDHHRRVFPENLHAGLRCEAAAATGSAEYGEYMVRFVETVGAYEAFRCRLEAALDGHPAIIVRFGDHQPSFTASMTGRPPTDPTLYQTFYAIEPINHELPPDLVAPPVLDIAYLSTLALQAANIALDPVFATRAALLKAEPATYFNPACGRTKRFHRALVEAGAIDLP